jgi:hypothetical protein
VNGGPPLERDRAGGDVRRAWGGGGSPRSPQSPMQGALALEQARWREAEAEAEAEAVEARRAGAQARALRQVCVDVWGGWRCALDIHSCTLGMPHSLTGCDPAEFKALPLASSRHALGP